MAEVPAVHKTHLDNLRAGKLPEQVDLSELDRTDSSALALLLEWQAYARARGRRIKFTYPPQSLEMLARLSQTDALLGWNDSNGPDQK